MIQESRLKLFTTTMTTPAFWGTPLSRQSVTVEIGQLWAIPTTGAPSGVPSRLP